MLNTNKIPTWEELQTSYRKFGYADSTIKRDRNTYFSFINGYCRKATGQTSLEIISEAIAVAKKDFQSGLISRNKYIRLRRISAKLNSHISKGELEWMHLGPIDKKYANDANEELLGLFLQAEQNRHASAINYRSEIIIRQFLIYIEEKNTCLTELDEQDILDFLKYMKKRRKSGLRPIVSSMRYFFDFLIDLGIIRKHLRAALQCWDTPHLKMYKVLSLEEREQLLASIDRSTAIGKRDYAIYSLATDCGLRCADIVSLRLSDIDWKDASIFLVQSKTSKPVKLPFSQRTGDALADYILNGRCDTGLPYVFTKERFCNTKMTGSHLNYRLRKYVSLAGIHLNPEERISMHTFRRSLGTDLIDSGNTLELVAQILGHEGTSTVQRYISYTKDALLDCAMDLSLLPGYSEEGCDE